MNAIRNVTSPASRSDCAPGVHACRRASGSQLVAVAKLSDGSFWSRSVDVVVTLAACIE
jgi:hypothetical protein